MSAIYARVKKCAEHLRKTVSFKPEIGMILGSGLGNFGEKIEIVEMVNYEDIEGFPISTVSGHRGRFIFGYVRGVPVVCMQGRVHYYEGYSMEDVVLPTRLMHELGARVLVVSNAAGGINYDYEAGDLMLITDHISSFVPNPLIGPNADELGVRFPDMTHAYDTELQELIRNTANRLQIELHEGVYVQLSGPSFETPQEIKMLRTLGADAVGMSTVCEVIAARHCGMRVCGISFISNKAAGISGENVAEFDMDEVVKQVEERFGELVSESVEVIYRHINSSL